MFELFEVASYNNEGVRNIMKSCRQDKGQGCSWAIWTENLRNQPCELRTEWLSVFERWYRVCVSEIKVTGSSSGHYAYFLSAPLTVSVRSLTLYIQVLLTQTKPMEAGKKRLATLEIKSSVGRKQLRFKMNNKVNEHENRFTVRII